MLLVLDNDSNILATHDDTQIDVVLASSDYAGLALARVAGAPTVEPGGPVPLGTVVVRPAGGVYVPQSITRLQFVRQAKAMTIWPQVQAYLAAHSDVDDWWTYASLVERQSPVLIAAATAFGMDSAAIDAFFITAAQIV